MSAVSGALPSNLHLFSRFTDSLFERLRRTRPCGEYESSLFRRNTAMCFNRNVMSMVLLV